MTESSRGYSHLQLHTHTPRQALNCWMTAFQPISPPCHDANQCQRLAQSCLPRGRFLCTPRANTNRGELHTFTPTFGLRCLALRKEGACLTILWWQSVCHIGATSPAGSVPVHSSHVSHGQRCHNTSIAFVSLLQALRKDPLFFYGFSMYI